MSYSDKPHHPSDGSTTQSRPATVTEATGHIQNAGIRCRHGSSTAQRKTHWLKSFLGRKASNAPQKSESQEELQEPGQNAAHGVQAFHVNGASSLLTAAAHSQQAHQAAVSRADNASQRETTTSYCSSSSIHGKPSVMQEETLVVTPEEFCDMMTVMKALAGEHLRLWCSSC